MSEPSYKATLKMRFDPKPDTNPELVDLHPEKCIDMGAMDDRMPRWVKNTLAFHGWKNFAAVPTSGHTSLCEEFLYHARRTAQDSVLIRGTEVPFGPTIIREAYTLPFVETCSYNRFIQRRGDPIFKEEVSRALSLPNTQPPVENFPVVSLDTKAKFWRFFVESRILTPTPGRIVPWHVLVLLYCIIRRKTIDVVPLIHYSLKSQLNEDNFFFPCFISKICKKAGLRHTFHEDKKFKGFKLGPWTIRLIENCLNDGPGQPEEEDDEERRAEQALWEDESIWNS